MIERHTYNKDELVPRLWPHSSPSNDVLSILPESMSFLDGTWVPDHWTGTFINGLNSIRDTFANRSLVEVGVGGGTVSLFLQTVGARGIIGTDIKPEALESAAENLSRSDLTNVLLVNSSLLHDVPDMPIDDVIACIPQVPLPPGESLDLEDNTGNYYDISQVVGELGDDEDLISKVRDYHRHGLALNFELLVQASQILDPGGRVILNLAGRPGKDYLTNLFEDTGFAPQVVFETVVEQDPETDIGTLVAMELDSDETFEFFSDPHGEHEITATAADKLRNNGGKIYHKIYVVEGTKI